MVRKISKKTLALILACVITAISIPPVVRSTAHSFEPDENGYYVAELSDFIDVSGDWTEKCPELQQLGEENSQGVRLIYNGGDVGRCIPTSQKYNADGFSFRLANLKKLDGCTDTLRFAVVFSTSPDGIGDLRIQFDTQAGTISYFSGTVAPVTVATDDILKYDSLCDSEFEISFNSNSNGDLECTVTVGHSSVTGAVPKSHIYVCQQTNFALNVESCYVKLAPGRNYGSDDYYFSVDVLGMSYDDYTRPTSATLNAVCNVPTSVATSLPNGAFPRSVECKYNGHDVGYRIVSRAKYKINNLHLRFDSLKKMAGHESSDLKFAINFTTNPNSIGNVRVMVDTATGIMSYFKGNFTPVKIAQSDVLKYDNLSQNEFVISFKLTAEKSCICNITVGDTVVSGEVPSDFFANLGGVTESYFAIAPGTGTNYFTVNLTGVKVIDTEALDTVIAEIDALTDITAQSGNDITKALNDYNSLNGTLRGQVTNIEKLYSAIEAYIEICTKQLDRELTAADGVTVNGLNEILQLLSSVQAEEISNYKAVVDLDTRYRAAIRGGLVAPYSGSEWSTLVNSWWSGLYNYSYMPNRAGAKIVYTGGGRDVGQGFNTVFNMDGLKIQFNAFRKTDDASKATIAIYYSDVAGSAWNSANGKKPFVLTLDMQEGTLTAHPYGQVLITDELLKYENIRNSTFSIETDLNEEFLYEVRVTVGTETVTGVISPDAITAGEQLTNPKKAYLKFSVWATSNYSYELTGIGPSDVHAEVVRLIDEIAMENSDNSEQIYAVKAAYDSLPQYAKNRVNNYSLLEDAIRRLEMSASQAKDVELLIERIGTVGINSYSDISAAENAYDVLPVSIQKQVSNYAVLEKAIKDYYALVAPKMYLNSSKYAPVLNKLNYNSFSNWPFWPDKFSETELETGGIRFNWFNKAGRNFSDSYGDYSLKDLELTFDNFTAEDEEGVTSTKTFAIYFSNSYSEYRGGSFNYQGNISMAVVLDTLNGNVTVYRAGGTYIPECVVLEDEALKYDNISGKVWSVAFTESVNGSYKLRLVIEDGTVLTGTIPYSLIKTLDDIKGLDNLDVGVSAWVDPGKMSVDLISIRTLYQTSVYESVMPIIEAIDALPAVSEITLEHEKKLVEPILNMYSALEFRQVKQQVTNYNKLSAVLWRLDELKAQAGIDPYTGEKYYFAQ